MPHPPHRSNTDLCSKLPSASTSDSSVGRVSALATAAAATLGLLLPLADPLAAAAATEHVASGGGMYWTCLGLGAAGVVTTLLCPSRFLLSYFPGLEKAAKTRPRAMLLRAVTAADPLLDPITKGVFRMTEQGDLNYGAMTLMAVVSGVLAVLLGQDGMLVAQVPDPGLLAALQYLVFVQHVLLLPMWTFVVFRYFMLI